MSGLPSWAEQMKALENGAQLGLMFQSIAGTEKALRSFGVTPALLDEAHEMTQKLGQVQGPNVMYFETGQGSALSASVTQCDTCARNRAISSLMQETYPWLP